MEGWREGKKENVEKEILRERDGRRGLGTELKHGNKDVKRKRTREQERENVKG